MILRANSGKNVYVISELHMYNLTAWNVNIITYIVGKYYVCTILCVLYVLFCQNNNTRENTVLCTLAD